MKNKLYFDYILMQGLYFMLLGVLASYGSYALLQIGFSVSKIGVMMAISSLLSALLQPIAANISDNSKRFSLFNVCVFISLACVLLSTLTYIQNNASLLMAVIFTGLLGIYTVVEPLINTVPSILKNNGIEINYGVGRAVGSLGYAFANATLGILTGFYPYQIVFISTIVVSILLLVINIKANKDFLAIPKENKTNNNVEVISYSQFLNRHKSFIILMICLMGIYLGYTMTDNMMILVVENVGGTSSDLGMIMAFKACLEVPVIFFYDKLEKLASPEKLLKFAVSAFVVKGLILYLAKSVTMIYIDQILQMFSFSIEVAAIVSYISKIMDKQEIARGQALFIMAVTIAQVLSSLLSGIICDYLSTNTMNLVALSVTTLSAIAFIITLNKTK